MDDDLLARELRRPAYPRAAAYEPRWVLENLMGPNVLWLAESLAEVMHLAPGMRILDMGCGKAVSSVFLAKEFDVQVWAADLWIAPSDNWARIREAGVADRVFPLRVEAHSLPFADGFFDAAVSLDAYHYFGTDDLYIGRYARLVRPGGEIGISVPGLMSELEGDVPGHLQPFWDWQFCSFHSPDWWRHHWERSGQVRVTHADLVPGGWEDWLLWLEVAGRYGYPRGRDPDPSGNSEAAMLRADAGRNLGFARVVARRA